MSNKSEQDPDGPKSFNDLTDLQKALATSESMLRAIVEAAVDFGIIMLDEVGHILDWNRGAEIMFGYTKNEVLGHHTALIFTPEDRHAGIPQKEIDTARNNGRSIDERWHLHRDGSRFFISGVMTSAEDNGRRYYVKIARNITDRKLAEEALFVSEQRKSLAFHSAEMGEWEWDKSAGKVTISEQVAVLAGIADGDRSMTPKKFMRLVYPDDQTVVKEQVIAALGGLNIFQSECRILRADNRQIRWVNVYGRVIAHTDKGPSKMIGVVYDITPRKLLEEQRDDFISMASHELKTPVTAVKTYGELLEENLSESGDKANLSLLRKLNVQVDRLIDLMQNLLDSSTLLEGRMKLYPETFDLNEMLNEQIDIPRTISAHHKIKWEASPVPLVHADRRKILQVINNFVSNAVKYSPLNSEIIISMEDMLDHVRVSVKDAGMGIPEKAQQFVFERYYRGEHQVRDKGFGLGLYICAKIIKAHNGVIGLKSIPGHGSTFYFTLPYS